MHAQREEPALRVERELGLAHAIAAVLVGQQRLAAVAGPFHRPPEFFCQPEDEPVLGVRPPLGAESAAHVFRHDADAVLGDAEDIAGQLLADAVRVLRVRVQRVALLACVVAAQRAARLHVLRMDAADRVRALHDVRGTGKCSRRCRLVADLEDVADVVRALVPHRRRARLRGPRGVGHRGEIAVVERNQFGRVARLHEGLRNDRGHRIAHKAHARLG